MIPKTLILSCVLTLASLPEGSQAVAGAPPTMSADSETFLIESTAADFKTHVAPTGVAFRRVHPGLMQRDQLAAAPLLCGEFRKPGAGEHWEKFAALQTGALGTGEFENWLGDRGHCHAPNTTLDARRDLSDTLVRQYNR